MDRKHNRRRKLLVNSPLQNRIILSVAWPPALAMGVTGCMLLMYVDNLRAEAGDAHLELPSLVPTFITVIGFLGFSVSFVLMNALRMSHRIAGPVVSFRRTFDAIKAGDLSARTRLRKGDFVSGIADELNDFLEWLEEHEGRIPPSETPPPEDAETEQDTGAREPAMSGSGPSPSPFPARPGGHGECGG